MRLTYLRVQITLTNRWSSLWKWMAQCSKACCLPLIPWTTMCWWMATDWPTCLEEMNIKEFTHARQNHYCFKSNPFHPPIHWQSLKELAVRNYLFFLHSYLIQVHFIANFLFELVQVLNSTFICLQTICLPSWDKGSNWSLHSLIKYKYFPIRHNYSSVFFAFDNIVLGEIKLWLFNCGFLIWSLRIFLREKTVVSCKYFLCHEGVF